MTWLKESTGAQFLSKPVLWRALDAAPDFPRLGKHFQLKWAQDVCVFFEIMNARDNVIAEVGGGDSRVLSHLHDSNRRLNIDTFAGEDNGPSSPPNLAGVTNVYGRVGSGRLEELYGTVDTLFTVSVLEHIPTSDLESFGQEASELLSPNGRFIHMVDIYLEDSPTAYTLERMAAYSKMLSGGDQKSIGVAMPSAAFSTQFVTNSDWTMYKWRELNPELDQMRQRSQLCCLVLYGRKRR